MMEPKTSLDPDDWDELRALGHRMLDDMIDHIADIRRRPVWQAAPPANPGAHDTALPLHPSDLSAVYQEFGETIAPYSSGNVTPALWAGSKAAVRLSACWPRCWPPVERQSR